MQCAAQTHGTTVDHRAVPPNKPTSLKDGAVLRFGHLAKEFTVRIESSGLYRTPLTQVHAAIIMPNVGGVEARPVAPPNSSDILNRCLDITLRCAAHPDTAHCTSILHLMTADVRR